MAKGAKNSQRRRADNAQHGEEHNVECYYEILGVARDASLSDIQRAYRTLGAKHHPDRHSDAEEKEKNGAIFRKISQAYCTLKDSEARKAYDNRFSSPRNIHRIHEDEIDDLLENFFGTAMNDFFEHDIFGRRQRHISHSPFDMMDSVFDRMFDDPFFGHVSPRFGQGHRKSSSNVIPSPLASHTGNNLVNINSQEPSARNPTRGMRMCSDFFPPDIQTNLDNQKNFHKEYIDENNNRVNVSFKKSSGKNGSTFQMFSYSSSNF